MNGKDLFHAIGNIDNKYISEFADTSEFKKKVPFFLSPKFYTGIAAVFVIGMAVFIALQMNHTPIDIQNNSVHNNNVVSQVEKNDIVSPTIPYNNKADNADNTQTNDTASPADTDNFANADEHYYDNPKSTSEQVIEVLFSIRVCNAPKNEKLSENSTLKIKGDFNPLMSSSMGIGIEFEVTPYQPVTFKAESGYFVTWDKDSGEITNRGTSFTLSETTDFFWTFDGETKDTFIRVTDGNSVLSNIKISYDENSNYFYAEMIDQT